MNKPQIHCIHPNTSFSDMMVVMHGCCQSSRHIVKTSLYIWN